MIILDEPYVSEELKDFLETSRTPVLKNAFAEANAGTRRFNFVSDSEARKLLARGERLYTISENALDWIVGNSDDANRRRAIETMKNKTAMRRLLRKVYPDFFFREIPVEELRSVDFDELPVPVILKPSIGFFSVGVHTIRTREDWESALADVEKNSFRWKERYPSSVLGNTSFLVEQYIRGEEYAVDLYFDSEGKAVVLNVIKHEFASAQDVSDRLYYTSKKILLARLALFTEFFDRVNAELGAKNFPAHVELRVENGRVVPIEFNPMRFAGLCSNEVSLFAFGFRSYEYFLKNEKPDWEKILAGTDDASVFTLCVLTAPSPCPDFRGFDYAALRSKFEKVLCLREMDAKALGTFGFLFIETRKREELDFLLSSDLTEFLVR
ncbi:MAG: ATP-grasp domain-containing protein [Candidatus Spyradosoma sp.]